MVLAYGIWLLLAALAAYVAWSFHATIVALVSQLVNSPGYRPFGWTSESVQPFSRFSLFLVGSGGLIYALWLENRLQRAAKEGELWGYALRTLVIMLIILGICLGALRL